MTRTGDGERRVGLVGLGAIGSELAGYLLKSPHPYRITALVRRRRAEAPSSCGLSVCDDVEALIAARPHLAVEAAGHAAVATLVPQLLTARIPVVIASVGSLADDGLCNRLEGLARRAGVPLIVPPGAIGGLDYLRAVSRLRPLQVVYTSRKPPDAWRDELEARGITGDAVTSEMTLFEGSAREAAALFPKNLNVAATLSVFGTGMDATRVRVVVDPAAKGNSHEIDIIGPVGEAHFRFCNTPSPANPKTSMLTAVTIASAVETYFDEHSP